VPSVSLAILKLETLHCILCVRVVQCSAVKRVCACVCVSVCVSECACTCVCACVCVCVVSVVHRKPPSCFATFGEIFLKL